MRHVGRSAGIPIGCRCSREFVFQIFAPTYQGRTSHPQTPSPSAASWIMLVWGTPYWGASMYEFQWAYCWSSISRPVFISKDAWKIHSPEYTRQQGYWPQHHV